MGQSQLSFQEVLKKLEEADVYPRWYDTSSKEISFEKLKPQDIEVIENLGGIKERTGEYTTVYKFE